MSMNDCDENNVLQLVLSAPHLTQKPVSIFDVGISLTHVMGAARVHERHVLPDVVGRCCFASPGFCCMRMESAAVDAVLGNLLSVELCLVVVLSKG